MRKILLALLIPVALFGQGSGQPINIPITASGWQFGLNTGPYGTNGCYAGNGTAPCTQDVGKSPSDFQEYQPGYAVGGFYTFSFTVANYFPNYPAWWTAEIDFGSQELCYQSSYGDKVFTQITLVCPSPGYLIVDRSLPSGGPPQGKQHLIISLHGSNWKDNFDNVLLTFTPSN